MKSPLHDVSPPLLHMMLQKAFYALKSDKAALPSLTFNARRLLIVTTQLKCNQSEDLFTKTTSHQQNN
jgi:hypothetical protein